MAVLKQLEKAFVERTTCSICDYRDCRSGGSYDPVAQCARSERVASTAAVNPNIKSTFIDDG
jgi:hypothetical protein